MSENTKKIAARVALTCIFAGVGALHFLVPDRFVEIVPPYLPAPLVLTYVSGVFEILGGLGVWAPWPTVRKWVGYGLVALLVSVYIVNIDMALHGSPLRSGIEVPPILLWLRLPLQFVMMWLAIYGTRPSEPGSDRPSGERVRAPVDRHPAEAERESDRTETQATV